MVFDFAFIILKAKRDNPRLATSARLCPASDKSDMECMAIPTTASIRTKARFRIIPTINAVFTELSSITWPCEWP
jgi:hypothetical protein